MPTSDPAALRDLAVEVAQECGRIVAREFGRPTTITTKSTLVDIVTEVDVATEQQARRLLTQARPQDGLCSEETVDSPGSSGLTWVIDPIDGTVNFVHGIAHCAVSVAVVRGDPRRAGQWQPVAGCVYNPLTGQTWQAAQGLGATLTTAEGSSGPLRLGQPPQLETALVATGFSYSAPHRAEQAQVLTTVLPQVRDLRRSGSAALDLCGVASGIYSAYYERGVCSWDIAAGRLIATEAGATYDEIPGPDPASQTQAVVIAAADPLAGQLRALLERATGSGA